MRNKASRGYNVCSWGMGDDDVSVFPHPSPLLL